MTTFRGVAATIGLVNQAMLRPFRQRVDIETVALLFVLLAVVAGGWHLVLERVEL